MVYGFCSKYSYEDYRREVSRQGTTLSQETIADWQSYCREVCMADLDRRFTDQGRIGGETSYVQVDEAKIGKRKHHVGRIVDGSWIFGMIDMFTGDLRIEILQDNKRDEQTLKQAIEKHIKPGTTIISDQWLGYINLSRPDHNNPNATWYNHMTVNHSQNFVDPDTSANTQLIESTWRSIKKQICRGGVHKDALGDHLCEYLWLRRCSRQNLDPFNEFIQAIVRLHPL